jgi:hypothetical protein
MRDYFDPASRDDDLFEAEEVKRRQARRQQAREAQEAAAVAERQQSAAIKSRLDERAREANRRQVIAEYQAAGVEPLQVDGDGKPTVSLSMLLRFGWKVEIVSGQPTLIRPFGMRAPRPIEEPVFGAPVHSDEESENPAP